MLNENFMLVLSIVDIIGTVAFAVSGVLVGIRSKLDLFGIYVLALATASGGGIIRDIVIGREVPVFFIQWKYFAAISVTMVTTCLLYSMVNRVMSFIVLADAVGLGVFTVIATYKAMEYGLPVLGIVFAGVITGVGGGILRDIMVNEIPLIFRSEVYAVPSIVGSLMFYFLYDCIGLCINIYLCVGIIFAIRMISVKLRLHLPVISKGGTEPTIDRSRKNFRM
ncbi:trimeric intracellular cation channel family protein [Ruminiclostridium cellulolyticum]|nr:TRIC cation channel family protein [Ruminiclostridium cellulolyticum]